MRIRFSVLITLAFVLVLSWTSSAQFLPYFDIGFQWKTIETPHFSITYHQGLEGMSQEAAKYAEESYELLKKELGRAPEGKINIIMYDEIDLSNGSANPFPRNTINILTVGTRLAEWANVKLESWIKVVVFHELLHIFDLDEAQGINAILRKIFGRIILPQDKPISFIEGLAVYEKYKNLGESRLNDSRTEMIMRTFVKENRIPTYDDMLVRSVSRDHWPPGGLLIYQISSWFLRYLEETYGKDTMKKINDVNSSQLENSILTLFFGLGVEFGKVLKKVTGKTVSELIDGYHVWLRVHFETQLEAIQKEGIAEGTRLTTYGWQTNSPMWSGDGKWILYNTGGTPIRSGFRRMDADGQHDQEIIPGIGFMQLPAYHPKEEKIVYQKLEFNGPFYVWGDLYEYDLAKKKEQRLTYGQRAYFSQYSPDGQKLYFAKHIGRDGSTAIAMMDLATKKIETVKEFPNNDILVYSFEVSPDGKQLALSAWRRGGFQDIYLMPASGGDLTSVTQDKDVDLDPTWSPDGAYVLFSSDRGGVSNLYAYKAADGTFAKVTNTLTGAYDPDVSPDGKQIVYTGYTGEGYDIFKMNLDPSTWKSVQFTKETIPAWDGYPKTNYPIHGYNPLLSLLPTFWVPIGDMNSIGFFTMGQDITGQHTYALIAGYDFKHKQPFYDLNYSNSMLPLNIDISVGQSATSQHQGISVGVPLKLGIVTTQFATIGYSKDHRVIEKPGKEKDETITETKDSETWLASYSYSTITGADLFRDILSVRLSGSMTTIAGQEKPERKLTVDWRDTFKIPTLEVNIIAFKMAVGWSDVTTDMTKEKAAYYLGGSSGSFLLRGFKQGSILGQYALASSLEYRFRLLDINKGVGTWPIFLDDLVARAFVDAGLAGDRLDLSQTKTSFGAELRLTTVLGYFNQTAFRLGIAQGLGEKAPMAYFDIGTSF
ncbi:PD40 domain-containing protein [Candidatus Acetothermia bacterium]|nr:PD40 domain-containing protein [Candidatus Acetothermia bacterium]